MDLTSFKASASVVIAAPSDVLYEFIADMPRIGEVSPEATGGTWQSDRHDVGALFIGTNKSGDRTWERRLRVIVAEAPKEFAWENLGDAAAPPSDDDLPAATWRYTFRPVTGGTNVEETWGLCDNPRLEAVGEEQLQRLQVRVQAGMEQTLANLKALFER
jgi:hypothetical protein